MNDEEEYQKYISEGYKIGTFTDFLNHKYGNSQDSDDTDTGNDSDDNGGVGTSNGVGKVETATTTTTNTKVTTPTNTTTSNGYVANAGTNNSTQAGSVAGQGESTGSVDSAQTGDDQIDDNLQYTYGGRTLTGAELKQHQKEMTDKYGEGYREYEWGKAVTKAEYEKHLANVEKYGEDYATLKDGRVMSRDDYDKLVKETQQKMAQAQSASKPKVQAQAKSIEHAEVKDGIKLHYYMDGNKKVYNPDDYEAWLRKTDPNYRYWKEEQDKRDMYTPGTPAFKHKQEVDAYEQQQWLKIRQKAGAKYANKFWYQLSDAEKRNFRDMMPTMPENVKQNDSILPIATSSSSYRQTVYSLQKAENRRVWNLNHKDANIKKQKELQEQANVLRDALGEGNFMQQQADMGTTTLDANMMPTQMSDEGAVTVEDAEGNVGLADAYGNQYFDAKDEKGNIITAQEQLNATQSALHQQRRDIAQAQRDMAAKENEYRRTHNRPETEPVKSEGESDKDYYQRMKWWYDDQMAEYNKQADEAERGALSSTFSMGQYGLNIDAAKRDEYESICAKRDAFRQDMEQNHPELFARNWEAVRQEFVALRDNLSSVVYTGVGAIAEAVGDYVHNGNDSNAYHLANAADYLLKEIQERKNNAKEVSGFVGNAAQKVHQFGLTTIGTIVTACAAPESAALAIGGALIKADMFRMIAEGAGEQMIDARQHGASDIASLTAGAENAAIWALVGKFMGTPYQRAVNKIMSQYVGEASLAALNGLKPEQQKIVQTGFNNLVELFIKEGGTSSRMMRGTKGLITNLIMNAPREVGKTTLDMTTANTLTSLVIPMMTVGDERSVLEPMLTGEEKILLGKDAEATKILKNLKSVLGSIPETVAENATDAFTMGLFFYGLGYGRKVVNKVKMEKSYKKVKEQILDKRNEHNGKEAPKMTFAFTNDGYVGLVIGEGNEHEVEVTDKDGNKKTEKKKTVRVWVPYGEEGSYVDLDKSSIMRTCETTEENFNKMESDVREAWRESQREIGSQLTEGQKRGKALARYRQSNSELRDAITKEFSPEEKEALNDLDNALANGVFTPEHEALVREYMDANDQFQGIMLGVEHEQGKILGEINQIAFAQGEFDKMFAPKEEDNTGKTRGRWKNRRRGDRQKEQKRTLDMERKRQEAGVKKRVIGGTMTIGDKAHKVYVLNGKPDEKNGFVQVIDVEEGKTYQTNMGLVHDVQEYDYDAFVAPLLQDKMNSLAADMEGIVNRDVTEQGKPVTLVIDGMPKTCEVIGTTGVADGNGKVGTQYIVKVEGEDQPAYMTNGELNAAYANGLSLFVTPAGMVKSAMHSGTTMVGQDMKHYHNPGQEERPDRLTTVMKTDVNGNPLYEQSGVEATVKDFSDNGITGRSAVAICDNNIANFRGKMEEISAEREKLKAEEPTAESMHATNPRELKAAHDEWEQRMNELDVRTKAVESNTAFWEAVKSTFDDPLKLNQVTEELKDGEYGFSLGDMSMSEMAESLHVSEREMKRLDQFAKDQHKHIVILDSVRTVSNKTANGLRRGDVILMSKETIDNGEGVSFILGHEITHTFTDAEKAEFIQAVKEALGDEYEKQFKEMKKKYTGVYNDENIDADVDEEIACDFAGKMLYGKNLETASNMPLSGMESMRQKMQDLFRKKFGTDESDTKIDAETQKKIDETFTKWSDIVHKRAAELAKKNPASVSDVAGEDAGAMNVGHSETYNINTEKGLHALIEDYAKSDDAKRLGWMEEQIDDIVKETSDMLDMIHAVMNGDKYYDEFAKKDPTIRIDWRDGVAKPTVTWVRNNIEYTYDMSADTFCINNEALETILATPTMADLMIHISRHAKYTSDDYVMLYQTLRDKGFVVPCKGCFDAAARLKMLPSVAQKFVALVNKTIDERNADPEKFDESVRAMDGEKTESGLPAGAKTKEIAIRIGVAGDRLTEHLDWTQLMSAEGQTKALSDWGGIFRAWQRTGAGRPKDKLLPEPYTGQITTSVSTIIAPYGEKTPSFRDLEVNQGTGLRRNSHSEYRPVLAVDEIQFMRDAWLRNLRVFKYMKELDDVRLFGNMGVKFNMSGFPAWVEGGVAAGLDANGEYAIAEESVGGREFPYKGEDGITHYDGKKGLEEAKKYVNKDVSLSSVCMSVPHFIKCLTDVPTPTDKSGTWGSLIPFHASGATSRQEEQQGLGKARAMRSGSFMAEAFTDYDKGVTNFEDVQNDRFGEGWVFMNGNKAGKSAEGHKWEFSTCTVYSNKGLGITLYSSPASFLANGGSVDVVKDIVRDKTGKPKLDKDGKVMGKLVVHGSFYTLKDEGNAIAHPLAIDYNDKVRELGGKYSYKEAADFYVQELRNIGMLPRFDFDVPADVYLKMCQDAHVDPNHPKLGWKGDDNSWSPCDAESYYSVWCDYGMTDPETGELAPHNAVLEGHKEADAFEKALPENYLDIIKAGLERYSNRRSEEDARIGDAIVEYCKRGVAAGKMDAEEAANILEQHGFTPEQIKEVNPEHAESFSIYGETGIKRLEDTMNETDKQDALSIAEAMEKEKKTALQIKKATGWERGADGKWRYEMPDGRFKDFGNFINAVMNKTQFFFRLGDIWDDENLYKAYPELRDKEVEIISRRADYEGAYGAFIELKPKKNEQEMRSTMVHELQHGIQKFEGFARGGNTEMSFSILKDLAEEQQEEAKKLSTKIGKKFQNISGFGKYGGRSSIINDIKGLDTTLKCLDEYESLMVKYPEFFDGLSSKQVRDMSSYAYPNGYDVITRRMMEVYGNSSDNSELYNLQDINLNNYHLEVRPTNVDEVKAMRSEVEEVRSLTDKYVKKWTKKWKNFGFSEGEITSDGKIGFNGYQRLAGEVESRNVQNRLYWTENGKRNTLLSKSEDVARNDQLFREGEDLLNKKEYDKIQSSTVGGNVSGDSWSELSKIANEMVGSNINEASKEESNEATGHSIANARTLPTRNKVNDNNQLGKRFDELFAEINSSKKIGTEDFLLKLFQSFDPSIDSVENGGKGISRYYDDTDGLNIGNGVVLRLSGHSGKPWHSKYNGEGETYSLVIKISNKPRFKKANGVNYLQFVYDRDYIGNNPDVQGKLVSAIKEFCNGNIRFQDLPRPSDVKGSGKFGKYNLSSYDSEHTLQEHSADESNVQTFEKDGVKYSIVGYHGSAAEFDKFDLKFLGTGEGSQFYGAGHYISDVKGTGIMYSGIAKRNAKYDRDATMSGLDIAEYDAMRRKQTAEGNIRRMKVRNEDAVKHYQEQIALAEKEIDEAQQKRRKYLEEHGDKPMKMLYTVEIPDDNGSNYIDWEGKFKDGELKTISDKLYSAVIENDDEGMYGTDREKELLRSEINNALSGKCGDVYGTIVDYLGGQNEASKFLSEMGYTGIKVQTGAQRGGDGRGMNYVIFNGDDIKINNRENLDSKSRNNELFSVTPDNNEDELLMRDGEGWREYLDRLKKHSDDVQDQLQGGEDEKHYKQRVGAYDRLSTDIEKEDGRELRGIEEARRDSSKAVRDRINVLLQNNHVSSMNKRTLNSILRVIEKTKPENLTESMRDAERLVRHIEQVAVTDEVANLLATKGAKVNDKKQKVGKGVDIFTQDVLEMVNQSVGEMRKTGLEKDVHKLRSENWHLRYDEEFKDEEGNFLTREQRDAKIEENNKSLAELTEKSLDIKKSKLTKTSKQIDDDIEELENEMAAPDYKENENDTKRLTALRIQRQMTDADELLKSQLEMEKGQAEAENKAREYNAKIRSGQDADKIDEYKEKRQNFLNNARASQLLAASAQQGYLDAMEQAKEQLENIIKNGRDNFRSQVEEQKQRRKQIVHEAMEDITGTGKNWDEMNHKERDKHENVGTVKGMFTQGLDSFKYMCEMVAQNSYGTDGRIYTRFISGPEGVQHAAMVYAENTRRNMETLDAKAREIFGKDYAHMMMDNNSHKAKDVVTVTIVNKDGTRSRQEDLTRGQATYLHMLWKMKDGQAKLINMGFTDDMMKQIDEFIGKKNVRMADWLQDEFLKDLGVHDNEMYQEIYGTRRASVENYVPIRIDKSSVESNDDMSEGGHRSGELKVKVSSHTVRVVNKNPIDLSTDAYNLMLEHADEVEDFYAYAPVRRDLTYLVNSKAFRNQLNANSAGSYNRFVEAARIAVKTSPTDIERIDSGFAMLQKALVGLNVSYRNSTAAKQTLSVPAFFGYSQDPRYWVEFWKAFGGAYIKNIPGIAQAMASGMSMGMIDTKLFDRTAKGKRVLQFALSDTVAWCMENVPDFYQRVTEGNAGFNGIEKETDINKKAARLMDGVLSRGMIANRTIDALTCAVGIRAIYNYKYKTELKRIDKEAERRADEFGSDEERDQWISEQCAAARNMAIMDASIYYNATQQSNQSAFLAPIQMSRNFIARALSLYKNSPMSYARMTQSAINDIRRYANKDTRERMIQNYAHAYEQQGYDEREAYKKAKEYCSNQVRKSAFNAFLYGFALNHVWNVGGKGVLGWYSGMGLWQILLGIGGLDDNDDDDDKTKLEKAGQTLSYWATVPFQGLPGVTLAQGMAEEATSGRGLDLSLIAPELKKTYTDIMRCNEDFGFASPEMAWILTERIGRFVGLPFQAGGNVALGLWRMAHDGVELKQRNMMIDFMLMMNYPESNRARVARQLYLEAREKGMSDEEFIDCWAKAQKYQTDDEHWWNEQALTDNRRKKMIAELEQITRDPETRAKVNAYEDAQEAAEGMTSLDDIIKAYDATDNAAVKNVYKDRAYKIINAERIEENNNKTTEGIFNSYRRKAQGLPEKGPKPKDRDYYDSTKTGSDMVEDTWYDSEIQKLKPVYDGMNELSGEDLKQYLKDHKDEIVKYEKLTSIRNAMKSMINAAGVINDSEKKDSMINKMRNFRSKTLSEQ